MSPAMSGRTAEPVPSRFGPRSSSTRRHGWMAVLALAALGASAAGVGVDRAAAVDGDCTRVSMSADHFVQRWIPVSGWGWTSWRVRPSIWAWDRCNHGGLTVSVGRYDANVVAKGGQLRVSSVSYRLSTSDTWRQLPLAYSWPIATYSSSHVDMTRGARISHVRIATAVWARQDGSGWTGIASHTLVCNLVARTCS